MKNKIFKKNVIQDGNLISFYVEDNVTKKVTDFYNEVPFPHYEINDDKSSINLKGDKNLFFETATDEGGRILKELELTEEDCLCTFEMIIKTGEYFKNESIKIFNKRIVSEIVVRFNMEDPNKKYHIPIIVSPNSYSIWWSD